MKRPLLIWILGTLMLLALAWMILSRPSNTPGKTILTAVIWKPSNPAAWDEAISRFERANPQVQVHLDIQPNSSSQFHDVLVQRLRNHDSSVDVFLMDVVWPPEFASAGWTRPLGDLFPAVEREDFFPGALAALSHDGDLHGIPFNVDGGVLYYRKDLLDRHGLAPPATWPELVRQAEAVLAKENDTALHGFSGQFKQYEGLVCDMLEYVHSNGGDLMQPGLSRTREAIAFVRGQIIGKLSPKGVLSYEEQESLDLFKSGGAVFHRNWPYAWPILNDPAASRVAGKVGICRLPSFEEGGKGASALGGWSFGISPYSRNRDAGAAFVRFMTSPEIQEWFAVREGKPPARRSLYRDPEVLAANPHFADLLPALEAAVPRPKTPYYARVSRILQGFLHEAIAKPDVDLAALCADADERIRQALPTPK